MSRFEGQVVNRTWYEDKIRRTAEVAEQVESARAKPCSTDERKLGPRAGSRYRSVTSGPQRAAGNSVHGYHLWAPAHGLCVMSTETIFEPTLLDATVPSINKIAQHGFGEDVPLTSSRGPAADPVTVTLPHAKPSVSLPTTVRDGRPSQNARDAPIAQCALGVDAESHSIQLHEPFLPETLH